MALFNIKPGEYVSIRTVHGQYRGGRAQALLIFDTHVVLDGGGRHGTPIVATPENIYTIREPFRRGPRYLNRKLAPGA
jgi:hypothetical protein